MRIALIAISLSVLGVLSASRARAETLRDTFAAANRASAKGEFPLAIEGYERLLESGVDDPDVMFNLATTHAKAGHFGQAIRHFERTLLLSPSDDMARRDLEKAQKALGQKLASKTGEAVVATRPPLTEALFAPFRSQTLALSLLCAAWLLTMCLFALDRARTEASRLSLGIVAAVGVAGMALSATGLGVKSDWGKPGHRAIVIRDEAKMREGPDDHAVVSETLREGTLVRVLEREHAFVEIELLGARRGFVAAADVGEI